MDIRERLLRVGELRGAAVYGEEIAIRGHMEAREFAHDGNLIEKRMTERRVVNGIPAPERGISGKSLAQIVDGRGQGIGDDFRAAANPVAAESRCAVEGMHDQPG